MFGLYKLEKLIGNTPLIKIKYRFNGAVNHIYAKLEWYNFSGSIKDRPAFEILNNALKRGLLKPGQTICETSSGNMGISICSLAKTIDCPVVICLPKFMSEERKQLLKLYGAKLELTENFQEAFKATEEFREKDAFLTCQFENEDNVFSHFKTGKEILTKQKDISAFVSGVGTGGTLMGVGKYLKDKIGAKIIAIEPSESRILSLGKSGKHKIQGLSDEIVPKIYDKDMVDKIIPVKSDDAICMAQKICAKLGLGVGISSGANFLGCVLSEMDNCATIFVDDNKKYLSTDLSNKMSSSLVDSIDLISFEYV